MGKRLLIVVAIAGLLGHVTLHAPVMVVTDILASPQVMRFPEASRFDFEAPTHSPPELYTLHSSLLI